MPTNINISVEKQLNTILRVGVLHLSGMQQPADNGEEIWQMFSTLSDNLCLQYAGGSVSDVHGVQGARRLYRAVGLDPTKTRPSSEALLRRSIKGKGVYRVHPLVDMLNFVSLRQLIPVGLYDVSRIKGPNVRIQIGEPGWGFDGIRKSRVNVAGRLCVCDSLGPFGSPTSDSLRTSIEGDVSEGLVLLYQNADDDHETLEQSLTLTRTLIFEHLNGAVVQQQII
ncbi:MAG: hypothetical protein JXX14_04965 [Deltaproteobacteria bacterium]|nr:hypothetical protein [Deltaproteobacteria bacterium]